MVKYFSLVFATIFVVILQLGLLPGLSIKLPLLINLPLLLIVFVAYFYDTQISLFLAIIPGLLLDIYSPLFFGFFTIVFLVEVMAIIFFTDNILQHRNLSVLILINFIAIIIWQVMYLATIFILFALTSNDKINIISGRYFIYLTVQILTHFIIILFLYKISSRFRYKLSGKTID